MTVVDNAYHNFLYCRKQRKDYERVCKIRTKIIRRFILLACAVFLLFCMLSAYSPVMSLRSIRVAGNMQVKTDDIVAALRGEFNKPLAFVDPETVRKKLAKFKLLKEVTVEAKPPGAILIRVSERVPLAFLERPDGFHVLDEDGVSLKVTQSPPLGMVRIDVKDGNQEQLVASLGWVIANIPDALKKRVDLISAETPSGINLKLDNSTKTVFWGSFQNSKLKAKVLEKLLSIPGHYSSFNVSAPEAPAVS